MNIVLIIGGLALIVFCKKFVQGSLEFQKKHFGILYGEKEEKSMYVLALVLGIGLMAMAISNF